MNQDILKQWRTDKGDETLRFDYPLTKDSVVFDVGGFRGDWSAEIEKRYGCKPYIFEPLREYFNVLRQRFPKNERIANVALSNKTATVPMSIDKDGSSLVIKSGKPLETVKTRDIVEFIKIERISFIDLLKINAEGSEYEIIPRLIESQFINQIDNLQIQFHEIDEFSHALMIMIQKRLSITHKPTYQYEFVWENWEKK